MTDTFEPTSSGTESGHVLTLDPCNFSDESVTRQCAVSDQLRQRAAFRRGVIRSAVVFAVITFIIALLAGLSYSSAVRARAAGELATAEAERATRLLYVSNINRTQQLFDSNNVGRALGILKEIAADPRQAPLRGFEWAYLYGLCHPERKLLHGFRSWGLAFAPNGALASLGREGLQIWAPPYEGRAAILKGPNPEGCNTGAFSPDGRRYVMGDSEGGIYLWDVQRRTIERQARIGTGVQYLTYSSDGRLIGSACGDGTARLWDAATLRPVRSWKVDSKGNLYTIGFSPDNGTIATGGADGLCRLWDAGTGTLKGTLRGHSWYIYTLAFSRDGETLATAGGDRLVAIWDWKTGKRRYALQGHGSFIYGMGFSGDGRTLATASWDNTVRVWDTRLGVLNRVVRGHTSHVYTTAFAPDGKTLASGGNDGTVRLWDTGKTEDATTLFQQSKAISWPQFSPDETAMIYSSPVGFRIYTFKSGVATDLFANCGEIGAAEFAGNSDRAIGSLLTPGPNRRDEWECPALLEWDAVRKNVTRRLDIQLHNFGISADGKLLAGSSPGGDIEIWDLEKLKRIQSILWTGGTMVRFTFSPDNRFVIGSGTGLEPCAWDVTTGRQLYTLAGHMGSVHRIAFSPDGRYILTAGHEPSAYLWDSSTGRQLATFNGHSQIVNGVAFSSDGKRILTASADFTVKIWDVVSARELVTFTGHSRDVGSAIFRSGGREIVSTGMDGLLLAWRSPTSEQVAAWQAEDSRPE